MSGVVTQDVKGRGPGMITITDGNALELPLMLKFPKVMNIIYVVVILLSEPWLRSCSHDQVFHFGRLFVNR